MGLVPCSVSGRVVDKMASETTFLTRQTTRQKPLNLPFRAGFDFQSEEPFCFSEMRGDAKIKMSTFFSLGDLDVAKSN